jgi:hypothetical protein
VDVEQEDSGFIKQEKSASIHQEPVVIKYESIPMKQGPVYIKQEAVSVKLEIPTTSPLNDLKIKPGKRQHK